MTPRELRVLQRLADVGSAGLSAFDVPVSERCFQSLQEKGLVRFCSDAGEPVYQRWLLTADGVAYVHSLERR